jgi:hypothetical protein
MPARARAIAAALLGVAAVLLPAIVVAGPDRPGTGEEKGRKPRLRLLADPAVHFTPVTVVLTGQLTGVDPADANFCHPAVTWVRIDPGMTENEATRVREDPACVHPAEQLSVSTSFTKTYDLERPGSYLFRLEIEGKDGARIVSGFVKVQVLRVQ